MLPRSEVFILGAGVIGLSLALELRRRGVSVAVVDRGAAGGQASAAAAGMLAVEDPHNPPELLPLSQLSGRLYPSFLQRIADLSGFEVPFQTEATLQTMPDGSVQLLDERSLDPRQLAPALLRAVRQAGAPVREHAELDPGSLQSGVVVHATGAWAGYPVSPRKGQMLRLKLPPGGRLHDVHRSEHVYVVPRHRGPQAGTALVGATVEDAGFDLSTSPDSLAGLRHLAAELVPEIADEAAAPVVEAWAGLRPATPDHLPLLGEMPGPPGPRHLIASGHFRNGILLAPATAVVLADLIAGIATPVDLVPFSPTRFRKTSAHLP